MSVNHFKFIIIKCFMFWCNLCLLTWRLNIYELNWCLTLGCFIWWTICLQTVCIFVCLCTQGIVFQYPWSRPRSVSLVRAAVECQRSCNTILMLTLQLPARCKLWLKYFLWHCHGQGSLSPDVRAHYKMFGRLQAFRTLLLDSTSCQQYENQHYTAIIQIW